jgi:hypothetical protein
MWLVAGEVHHAAPLYATVIAVDRVVAGLTSHLWPLWLGEAPADVRSSKRCWRPSEKEVLLVSARIGNDPTFIERVATEGHACY